MLTWAACLSGLRGRGDSVGSLDGVLAYVAC